MCTYHKIGYEWSAFEILRDTISRGFQAYLVSNLHVVFSELHSEHTCIKFNAYHV